MSIDFGSSQDLIVGEFQTHLGSLLSAQRLLCPPLSAPASLGTLLKINVKKIPQE